MDVGEIRDRESLEAWLNSLPRGTEAEREESHRWAVLIAHRAAMRVLPIYWARTLGDTARKRDQAAMLVFLASLIGGVAGSCPSTPITLAAAAVAKTSKVNADTGTAASAAFEAAVAALSLDGGHYSRSYFGSSRDAYSASSSAAYSAAAYSPGAVWNALRKDCAALVGGRDPNRLLLWSDKNPVAAIWASTRRDSLAQSPSWRFWVDWYDRALKGEEQDWDLLTKIALIDPRDWEKGADHVNALIAEIRLKHLAETRPLGEDSIDKGADGLWRRVGRPDIDRDILADACDRVADTVKRIRAAMKKSQNNALTALTDDLKTVTTDLRRYRDRPLRLHDTFLKVQRHIARDLASGELPDDHLVDDLVTDLGTAALDMRNACAKTRQVVAARASARFAILDERERTAIVQIAEAAASLSDAPLAAEFREDAAEAVSLEIPPQDKSHAQYRLHTRLAKMASEAGDNILAALIKIGEVGDGLSSISDLAMLLLRFIL